MSNKFLEVNTYLDISHFCTFVPEFLLGIKPLSHKVSNLQNDESEWDKISAEFCSTTQCSAALSRGIMSVLLPKVKR